MTGSLARNMSPRTMNREKKRPPAMPYNGAAWSSEKYNDVNFLCSFCILGINCYMLILLK